MSPEAVIFDLDGVLLRSEPVWETARREVTLESGGRWPDDAQTEMMGMSTPEWSAWMHETLAVPLKPEEIVREVLRRMDRAFRDRLPLLPGAREAVAGLAGRWTLGLASSSSRPLIDLSLELSGLAELFRATVSSEEVERGKPAPDVYLRAAELLEVEPEACVAIEDSSNGLRAGAAAGMRVIAIPDPEFPPEPEALELAAVELRSLAELQPATIARIN
jgi:HAD superfamily hydrolase (TIGR01509 family)